MSPMKHASVIISAGMATLLFASAASAQFIPLGTSQFNPPLPPPPPPPKIEAPVIPQMDAPLTQTTHRRHVLPSATASTGVSTKEPPQGSGRTSARPIRALAPISELQFRDWIRNARNESCGLSTSEITQPSDPFTRMKFSVIARPLLSKATAT